MGFQFQRRINIGEGWGVNLSKSGMSLSFRSKYGSINGNGFSLRTGIPGLSYRFRAKKGSEAALIVSLIMLAFALIPMAVNVCLILISCMFQLFLFSYWLVIVVPLKMVIWLILTLTDYYKFIKKNG